MGETSLERSRFPHHQEVLPGNIIEDDPFEGEELLGLQSLMNRIDAPCSAEDYIVDEDAIAVCSGHIDPSEPNWREAARA